MKTKYLLLGLLLLSFSFQGCNFFFTENTNVDLYGFNYTIEIDDEYALGEEVPIVLNIKNNNTYYAYIPDFNGNNPTASPPWIINIENVYGIKIFIWGAMFDHYSEGKLEPEGVRIYDLNWTQTNEADNTISKGKYFIFISYGTYDNIFLLKKKISIN